MSEVEVRLFGAFRSFMRDASVVRLSVDGISTVAELKGALADRLGPELGPLVADSALADEDRLLSDDEAVVSGARLAILPPVCGG